MTDIGRAGMVTKGAYNSASTYETLDVVTYNNALYVAKQSVPAGTVPTNTTYWQEAIGTVTINKSVGRTVSYSTSNSLYCLVLYVDVDISSAKAVDLSEITGIYNDPQYIISGKLNDRYNMFSVNIDNATGHIWLNVKDNHPDARPFALQIVSPIPIAIS